MPLPVTLKKLKLNGSMKTSRPFRTNTQNRYPFHYSGEGDGTPLQYSCLENPMDGAAWKAAVHGIAEGRTWLSNFTFIIGDWNAKVGSQETPVTGKFGLGIWNEVGQRLMEFCQENALVIANTFFQQHKRRLCTWTSQMVNTEIRLIIFFAAQDGEALYSQQKQDQELTVAQIMNSLLPNSDWNWRK